MLSNSNGRIQFCHYLLYNALIPEPWLQLIIIWVKLTNTKSFRFCDNLHPQDWKKHTEGELYYHDWLFIIKTPSWFNFEGFGTECVICSTVCKTPWCKSMYIYNTKFDWTWTFHDKLKVMDFAWREPVSVNFDNKFWFSLSLSLLNNTPVSFSHILVFWNLLVLV